HNPWTGGSQKSRFNLYSVSGKFREFRDLSIRDQKCSPTMQLPICSPVSWRPQLAYLVGLLVGPCNRSPPILAGGKGQRWFGSMHCGAHKSVPCFCSQ